MIAVPTANKAKFEAHARLGDGVFIDMGALRVVECWADDVPDGKQTDFRRAVQATADEEIVFSWVEWPDKATRDAALETMKGWMANPESADPRMDPTANPMPFDGKRMIFGGFRPVVELVGPRTQTNKTPPE